jgi:hypothetical protein
MTSALNNLSIDFIFNNQANCATIPWTKAKMNKFMFVFINLFITICFVISIEIELRAKLSINLLII